MLAEQMNIGGWVVPQVERVLWAKMTQDVQHPPFVARCTGGKAKIQCDNSACGFTSSGTVAEAIRQWNLHLGIGKSL